ncbi:DUF805 domain-containing protein [Microvirga sp. P5_D2]|jgi:uncharacterized membrane protein YhaH (DUF805 family)
MRWNSGYLFWLLFSQDGRIGRIQWWMSWLAITSLNSTPWLISKFYEKFHEQYPFSVMLFELAMIYPAYTVDAKRFHDRSWSGLWAIFGGTFTILIMSKSLSLLYVIFPSRDMMLIVVGTVYILSFSYVFVLGFLQGTAGQNRYGIDPSTSGIFKVPSL